MMKVQEAVYEMTGRDRKVHKQRLRRHREQRKRVASIFLTIFMIVVCVVSYHSLTSEANDNIPVSLKYYTGVIVKRGDTLWTISDNYIDYTQYKSKQAYIDEVCSINNLLDETEIRAGQKLVVPYYSDEFVK